MIICNEIFKYLIFTSTSYTFLFSWIVLHHRYSEKKEQEENNVLKCWWSVSRRLQVSRILQLSSTLLNQVMSIYVMPGHMVLVAVYMILALFVSIRHYDDLVLHLYIEWPGLFVVLSIFVLVMYTVAAMTNEQSQILKRSMTKIPITTEQKAQILAFRPLRVSCHCYFYIKLSTAFLFLMMVLDNSIGLLMI